MKVKGHFKKKNLSSKYKQKKNNIQISKKVKFKAKSIKRTKTVALDH